VEIAREGLTPVLEKRRCEVGITFKDLIPKCLSALKAILKQQDSHSEPAGPDFGARHDSRVGNGIDGFVRLSEGQCRE